MYHYFWLLYTMIMQRPHRFIINIIDLVRLDHEVENTEMYRSVLTSSMTRAATEYEMYWNTIHRNVTDAAIAQVEEEKYIICNGPIGHKRITRFKSRDCKRLTKGLAP